MARRYEVRKNGKGDVTEALFTARKAIMHHCKECMGFQPKLVRGCTSKLCALFPYRLQDTHKNLPKT